MIVNNKILNGDKDIANVVKKHFTLIDKNLACKVVPQEPHSYMTYLTDLIDDSLALRPNNDKEILSEINQVNTVSRLYSNMILHSLT